jgi:Ca2+-binding RTX toxin-like protein
MASFFFLTTEYRFPGEASLYDIYIPTAGFATDITVEIDISGLPAERSIGFAAPLLFDSVGQQILFKPIGFSKMLDGDVATVTVTWTEGGTTSSADIVVFGQTGDEDMFYPVVAGTDGADHFIGGVTAPFAPEMHGDLFYGNAGDDVAYGNTGLDELHGGDGHDLLDGGAGIPGFVPQEGDLLFGEEGDDMLIGGGGGQGGDYLDGGTGNDILIGSGLSIGDGGDELYGGEGDDILSGLHGPDLLDGGAGFDRVDYSASSEAVVVLLARVDSSGVGGYFANFAAGGYYRAEPGQDPLLPAAAHSARDRYVSIEGVIGSSHDDLVFGAGHATVADLGDGDDLFDNYHPSQAGDRINGQGGNDLIWTGGGKDRLLGGAGNDGLFGEAGDDVLIGGAGDDFLEGGTGADVFGYLAGDNGQDLIADFSRGLDKISLPDAISVAEVLASQLFDPSGDLMLTFSAGGYETLVRLSGIGSELAASDFI